MLCTLKLRREDEDLMLELIKLVWEPATEGKHTLPVLDSFSAHVKLSKRPKEINTVPIIIPGGCTSKIQPLNVSLKPFKSLVRNHQLRDDTVKESSCCKLDTSSAVRESTSMVPRGHPAVSHFTGTVPLFQFSLHAHFQKKETLFGNLT